jgi:hypothetical protein
MTSDRRTGLVEEHELGRQTEAAAVPLLFHLGKDVIWTRNALHEIIRGIENSSRDHVNCSTNPFVSARRLTVALLLLLASMWP